MLVQVTVFIPRQKILNVPDIGLRDFSKSLAIKEDGYPSLYHISSMIRKEIEQ